MKNCSRPQRAFRCEVRYRSWFLIEGESGEESVRVSYHHSSPSITCFCGVVGCSFDCCSRARCRVARC